MIQPFEGERQAIENAEGQSRKTRDKVFTVAKSRAGSLHYRVYDTDEIQDGDKVLAKYKNGQLEI
jgi:hypothetical protein